MRSISLHSVRDRAAAGMLAVLMLAFGSSGAGAQEAKPAPTPAPADAKPAPTPAPADAKPAPAPAPADAKDKDKDKEKAGDKEAPLPADAHVAQSIQLDGKPLHYTVTVGTLPVYDAGKKTDRKSTRLNSSHLGISYAVFCLKKKIRKARHTPGLDQSLEGSLCFIHSHIP